MNETTAASRVGAHLTRARELMERGKQRLAIDELWEAEAQARGSEAATHELIDFTIAFERRIGPKQRANLVELLAALEHDAEDAWPTAPEPTAPTTASSRPPGQLALSVVSIIVASVVGVALLFASTSDFMCSTVARSSGEDVANAGTIALLGGIASLIAAIAVRNHARLLSAVLLGEVVMLSVVIGLVARDSATVNLTQDCGIIESDVSTTTHHVGPSYTVLGLVILVLVSQALRGWRIALPEQVEAQGGDPSAS